MANTCLSSPPVAVVRIMGGLGNQLFQYALALVLAEGGAKVFLESHFRRDHYKRQFALDFLSVRLPFCGGKRRRMLIRDKWDSRLLRRLLRLPDPLIIKDNDGDWQRFLQLPPAVTAYFVGYWQSTALVAQASELLIDLRCARDAVALPSVMAGDSQNIAVHARRLWEHDAHGNIVRRKRNKPPPALRLNLSYYERAFAIMRNQYDNPRFIIFSDDLKWSVENLLPLAGKESVAMPTRDCPDYQDMLLMAHCHGHIIANSTFSWWAATIGDGHVIAPKQWSDNDIRNQIIYPPEWEII